MRDPIKILMQESLFSIQSEKPPLLKCPVLPVTVAVVTIQHNLMTRSTTQRNAASTDNHRFCNTVISLSKYILTWLLIKYQRYHQVMTPH